VKQLDLHVTNLDCEHDAARLRRGFEGVRGVELLQVFSSSGKVRVAFDEAQASADDVKSRLAEIGFPAAREPERLGPPSPWKNPKVLTSVASGVLLVVGWVLSWPEGAGTASTLVYLLAVAVGGYYFGREALEEVLHERQVGIEMLMSVAALSAIALGQAGEAAMLVFLYSISEALEGYTEEKTRGAIRALMKLAPKVATLRRDGREVEVPVEQVAPGDIFLVRPGSSVPTDGVIVAGRSSLNQAPITGESTPVDREPDQQVFAGSINGEGSLEVRATKEFADNTLSRIIHLVEEAQEQKGRSQRFIERFGNVYSPAVLGAGVLLALLPPLAFGADWRTWLVRATVFLVAAAPCALAISVPITFVAALGTAARKGILIKGGVHLEEFAKVRVVTLDKTGTLTAGKPEVTDVLALAPERKEDVLRLAASVESHSEHPLARAIVQKAAKDDLEIPRATEFMSETGRGAAAIVNGKRIKVGSARAFSGAPDWEQVAALAEPLRSAGKSVVFVGSEERLLGVIGLRDNLRPGVKEVLQTLHREGVERVVMLTGDNAATAAAIAKEAGIDDFRAELRPEEKVTAINELKQTYGDVAMVGDGVNDAPALAAATVGVAMGAAGTDVALETADVALMADDLGKLPEAIRIAHRTRRVVRQNLALSVIVITVLVTGAVFDLFGLPVAVIGHELSELVVIASGLRMLRG
jgi:Cd2+/Zn2+-exporting ATPase